MVIKILFYIYFIGRISHYIWCLYRQKRYVENESRIIETYKRIKKPIGLKEISVTVLFLYLFSTKDFFIQGLLLMILESFLIDIEYKKDIVVYEDGLLYGFKHILWKQVFQVQYVDNVFQMKTTKLTNWIIHIGDIENANTLISNIPKFTHISFDED